MEETPTGREKGNANLKPVKKGEVRNPNGRPVGSMNRNTIVKYFADMIADKEYQRVAQSIGMDPKLSKLTAREVIQIKKLQLAMAGDVQAIKLVDMDLFGKAPEIVVPDRTDDEKALHVKYSDPKKAKAAYLRALGKK